MYGFGIAENEEDGIRLATRRSQTVRVDDKEWIVEFVPDKSKVIGSSTTCDVLTGNWEDRQHIEFQDVVMGGLYVEIKAGKARGGWGNTEGQYVIKGLDGWVELKGLNHGSIGAFGGNQVAMLVLETGVEQIFVNGVEIEGAKNARFRGHGDIWPRYRKATGLRVTGNFHAAWVDQRRLNRTNWERWNDEIKVGLVVATCGSLVAALVMLMIQTKERWIGRV